MKITMRGEITGTRNGEEWPKVGETIVVPDEEGADLCAAGLAVPVVEKDAGVEKRTPRKKTPPKDEE